MVPAPAGSLADSHDSACVPPHGGRESWCQGYIIPQPPRWDRAQSPATLQKLYGPHTLFIRRLYDFPDESFHTPQYLSGDTVTPPTASGYGPPVLHGRDRVGCWH